MGRNDMKGKAAERKKIGTDGRGGKGKDVKGIVR